MSPLEQGQVAELQSVLESELARLERSMKITDDALRPVELDQTAVGRLSRMDSLQNQSMSRSLHDRELVTLARIQAALRRIEDGSYGTCGACGAEIPYGRLLVFPEAETCTTCG